MIVQSYNAGLGAASAIAVPNCDPNDAACIAATLNIGAGSDVPITPLSDTISSWTSSAFSTGYVPPAQTQTLSQFLAAHSNAILIAGVGLLALMVLAPRGRR